MMSNYGLIISRLKIVVALITMYQLKNHANTRQCDKGYHPSGYARPVIPESMYTATVADPFAGKGATGPADRPDLAPPDGRLCPAGGKRSR